MIKFNFFVFTKNFIRNNVLFVNCRLAPSLIIMVTFTATIMRHTGHGPMWPQIVLTETNACQKDWWIVSLFLNNIAFDRQEVSKLV